MPELPVCSPPKHFLIWMRASTTQEHQDLKLYDAKPAPNPRRVRVFAAEKGMQLELVPVDLQRGEHKSPEFRRKNPLGQIPVLELDDGTCISESVAICRYLEGIQPAPSLFGDTPLTQALIEMSNRRLELGLLVPVGQSWVNGPVVARMLGNRAAPIPEAKARADATVHRFYERLDRDLEHQAFMAGANFSIADITAMCVIDFAADLVGLPPDPELAHLAGWRERVGARPSASA
jgi:glutathione S-transferase